MEELLVQRDAYIHSSTLNCILDQKCIVCLYKFIPKHAIKKLHDFRIVLPNNKRPETCPRSKNAVSGRSSSKYCGLYTHTDSILTLGDGDFSFSLSLIQDGHKPKRLYATSYESLQSITSIYQNCTDILQALSTYGVKTFHDVDASDISATSAIPESHFDIIIWNFPCIAGAAGGDGQVAEIEANKELLRKFFINAKCYLKEKGRREVHVTHKTIEPFSWWGLTDIATECGWTYLGSLVFDRCLYPGYINRKAQDKKSFTATDAETFVFWSPSDNSDETFTGTSTSSLLTNDCINSVETVLPRICDYLRQNYSSADAVHNDHKNDFPPEKKSKMK